MNSSLCVADINKFNGIGRREAHFNPVRVNNSYQIDRPSFRAGTTRTTSKPVEMPKQIRGGIGNRNITRINFTAPQIQPRDPVDFDKLNAVNLAQFGNKVQLSDKSINDLLRVSVPDDQDFAWLAEKRRLEALGDNSLPFGRKQRTVQKRINFGQASLSQDERINAIRQAVEAGRAESRAERANLGVQIAASLANLDEVRRMTEAQLRVILQSINRLNIPKHWRSAGFTHRLWTGNQFNQQKGPITMFILANVKPDRTPNQPLISWNEGLQDFRPASLLQLYQMNSQPRRVLDLQNAALITEGQAREMVLRQGVDNGMLNGVVIDPLRQGAPDVGGIDPDILAQVQAAAEEEEGLGAAAAP